VRLAVFAASPEAAAGLGRASVGDWVRAHASDAPPSSAPALTALVGLLSEVATGRRAAPTAVTPRALLEHLPAYRNVVIGHGATREAEFYDAASRALGDALLVAWDAGVFLRPGDALVHVESIEIDERGERAARVLELTGLDSRLQDPRGTPVPESVRPRRLYVRRDADWRPLHPLLLFEERGGRERVWFFNGRTRRAQFLDYLSGDVLRGRDLDEVASDVEAELDRLAAAGGAREAGAAPGAQAEPEGGPAAGAASGARLGDYAILGRLGAGGMGVVYLARQESLSRLVALKVLPEGAAADETTLARFRREVDALSRCDHPNVVKILASGVERHTPYYAMELVLGADLAEVAAELSKTGSFDAAVSSAAQRVRRARSEAFPDAPDVRASSEGRSAHLLVERGGERARRLAALMRDAARGLQHLHECGIIHRDVKPANLMLTEAEHRIVIMDLGLAAVRDASRALTRTGGGLLGTLRYVSPEQLQRHLVEVDARADVYSLGATFYELLCGRPLFDGDTEARLVQQVLRDAPLAPERANPALPRDLATILGKCLEKDPRRRYETAEALARDLDALLEGRAISARPPTIGYLLGLAVRRNRAAATVAAASLAALAALAGVSVERLRSARAAEAQARAVAESSLAKAEDLLEFLLYDLHHRLRPLGRLDVLEAVARRSLEYERALDGARSSRGVVPRAIALVQISEILEARGDAAEAIAAADRAVRLLEAADAHAGADTERTALFAALTQRGHARVRGSAPNEGLSDFRAALALAEAERAAAPGSTGALRSVAVAWERVALALSTIEGGDEALAAQRRCREVFLEVLARNPSDGDAVVDAATAEMQLGRLLREQGDHEGAERMLRGARERLAPVAERPDDPRAVRMTISLLLGDVLFDREDLEGARAAFAEGLVGVEPLVRRDPTNVEVRTSACVLRRRYAAALSGLGRAEEALAEARAALGEARDLLARDGGDALARRNAAMVHDTLGDILLKGGARAEALASYESSATLRRGIAGEEPDNPRARGDLAMSLQSIGDAHLALGALDEARAAYAEARVIFGRLADAAPTSYEWARAVGVAELKLGAEAERGGDLARAAGLYREAIARFGALCERRPGAAGPLIDLSAAAEHLGDLRLRRERDPAAARAEYARSLAALEAARAPGRAAHVEAVRRRVRQCAILAGEAEAETSAERLALAYALYEWGQHVRCARALEAAIADPEVRGDLEREALYNAACAASLASAATAGAESAAWRAKALSWLEEDARAFAARDQALAERRAAAADDEQRAEIGALLAASRARRERARREDPDLAAIRGLPEFERIFSAE